MILRLTSARRAPVAQSVARKTSILEILRPWVTPTRGFLSFFFFFPPLRGLRECGTHRTSGTPATRAPAHTALPPICIQRFQFTLKSSDYQRIIQIRYVQ
ncbi:uncharacterized protein BO87DRAFT_177407 [Aspergillus neoniger CBS 115656]|uniref:Uncharacterized protein n=1 Tax=Aspergillus neoniger (strain CBS 115656) TaxID=1448310 RepID=A0A318Y6S5_ASPNB|nr:hypothetical protein BO87DRAFT_177407 [Aspergillus neoniger CBS 115656]PYH29584.1 hypothetical protein BO87DRAFT_177407 [Aspergillus neoniger CBS 115656]